MLYFPHSRLSSVILPSLLFSLVTSFTHPAIAQVRATPAEDLQSEDFQLQNQESETQPNLDIPPAIIEESPTLQKWLPATPNILEEIKHDPSFRSRFTLGFSLLQTGENRDQELGGIKIAVEDIFIKRTGLTLSSDYQTSFNGDFINAGAELHYFLFPLGGFVNLAPLVGYRYFQQDDFNSGGINLGLRLAIALSRNGAADINISHSFINPQDDQEVGLFSLSVGYAITSTVRLATEWKRANYQEGKDNLFSLGIQKLF